MIRIVVVLLLLLMLGGCGMKDIDKRFYVVATGIDLSGNPDNPYRISLRLAITSAKVESGSSKTQVQMIDAPSVAEGVRHIKSFVDKELDFGHCRIFILGRSLLEQGPLDALNWLSRRRDIQMVSFLGVGEPDALSVLKITPESERYPGNALFLTFGNEGTESPYTVTSYLFDVIRKHYEKGLDPVLPVIRARGNIYEIDRVMLLDKNKMRLILNPEETQVYNMTAKRFSKSELKIPYPGGRIVMTVSQIRSKYQISKGATPRIDMTVKVRGILEESPPDVLEKDWQGIERKLGEAFSEEVEKLLYKIRDAGVDPYGFGLHYLATYFGDEKDFAYWQSIYPEVKFHVTTQVKIMGPGVVL